MIYHDGRFMPAGEAVMAVDALTLRYGLSVFEGIRAYRQTDGPLRPFMMDAHLERLKAGLDLLGFPDPGVEAVPDIVEELTRLNGFEDDCYIRPSVSAPNIGDLQDEPVPALTVTMRPMGRKKWLTEGRSMRATLARWHRIPDGAFPSRLKCIGAYVPGYVETRRAKAAGFDVPILMTASGHVSEAPTAAVAIVRDGVLIRPGDGDDALPSITVRVLFDLAQRLGWSTRESHISRDLLLSADEVFLCGTGLELAACGEIDGTPIQPSRPGPRLLPDLTEAYFHHVRHQ